MDKRHKNGNWQLPTNDSGVIQTWDAVHTAVLMDIRDELKQLNRVFACPNFQGIPQVLRRIRANTTKPKRRKATK